MVTSFVATETALTISVPSDLPVGEGNVTNVEDMNTIKLVSDYSEKLIEIKFAGNAGAPFITSVSHTMAKAGVYLHLWYELREHSEDHIPGRCGSNGF